MLLAQRRIPLVLRVFAQTNKSITGTRFCNNSSVETLPFVIDTPTAEDVKSLRKEKINTNAVLVCIITLCAGLCICLTRCADRECATNGADMDLRKLYYLRLF